MFRVRASVAASADGVGDLSSITFNGPALTISSNLTVIEAPGQTNVGTLAPGAQIPFEWSLRGDALGDFTITTATLSGRDASNRSVSAARATALGSVTALLAGLQQLPRRVVLGEDNNKDGVVNAADQRVEVILGITNVANVAVTDLRTDDASEPIRLVSRLADVPIALMQQEGFPAAIGTIQPGAANAIFRTNVYLATDYVYASASTLLRGRIGEADVQTGASSTVEVRHPGVSITLHALDASGLDNDSIERGLENPDHPLIPINDPDKLDAQRPVTGGLIGDGVTPLLILIEADSKALTVPGEELKLRLEAEVAPQGRLRGPSLQQRLRILKDGAWVASDTIPVTRENPRVYASLTPILSDEIEPSPGSGQLQAVLKVSNADSGVLIERLGFGLRKPPIALVHGYNTDGKWGDEAVAILKQSRPDDTTAGTFVHVIRYGQQVDESDVVSRAVGASINTTWSLESLVATLRREMLDAMEPVRDAWAFTPHDVIAHSQGGLLTRMLCSANPNPILSQPFRNPENFYRGRFHRVITIGSPHNGTRILRYMLTLEDTFPGRGPLLPRTVSALMVLKRVAQRKFDPWGPEIVNLNNQHPNAPWYPDPTARFHLVRTTVNDGEPPSFLKGTWADHALGLDSTVLPRGSDGVVDFDSMAATTPGTAPGANVYTLPSSFNVSHATISLLGIDDIFGGDDGGQVNAVSVARHAIGALDQAGIPDQHRVFGSIRPPRPLSFVIRDAIDNAARTEALKSNPEQLAAIDALEESGANRGARPAGEGAHSFILDLTPFASRPVGTAGVRWFAEVFGTNGVSTAGLRLTPDPSRPTRATLEVNEGIVGDVVAYAFYLDGDGSTVFSRPLRVASFEPATPPLQIRVLPLDTSLPTGDAARVQLFVRYTNDLWLERHLSPDELSVSTGEPLVLDATDPLQWRCLSAGKSTVTAVWRGLTNQGTVTVFGPKPDGLPVPDPLVWLRADAGIERDGTNLVSWTDQSRNNFTFLTSTPETRPAWVTNAINGLPAIRFTGANRDRLVGDLGRTLTNATIFTVCRFEGTASVAYAYAFGTRDFSGLMMTLARRSGHGAYHYDGAAERIVPNTIPGSTFRIFSQVYGDGTPDTHRLDVNTRTLIESRTTVGRPYSAVATNVILGKYVTSTSTGSMTGDIAEWIVYDRVLTPGERLEVEEYLRQRLGLEPFFTPGSLDLASGEPTTFNPDSLPTPNWSTDLAGREVTLTNATAPAFLLGPDTDPGSVIHARLRSDGTSGFIGFVLALRDPGNFLLLDWNRSATNHPAYGPAPAGIRLRAFHLPQGQQPNGTDFWSSPDPTRVSLLASTNTPWVTGRDYDLVIQARPDRTEIQITSGTTNVVQWSIPGIPDGLGRFGFFAHAAAGVRFGELALPEAPLLITGLTPEGESEATLQWMNGRPPYVIEATTSLGDVPWFELVPSTHDLSRRIALPEPPLFLRVRSTGP